MEDGDRLGALRRMLEGGPPLWLANGPARPLPDGVGAVVETSGSTGSPRRVLLSRGALLAAAGGAQQRLGGPLTWHLTLSLRYVAGLMVGVRSLAAGRDPVVASPDLGDLHATGEGDAVSLVPTQLHRALEVPALSRELARFDAVLVGGASLPAGLRGRAEDAGVNVIATYGMSETCGGCVWDGIPLPGAQVRILPQPGLEEGAGRIGLRGPMLFDGYLDDAVATDAALVDGTLLTSDFGTFEAGRLQVRGRLDDVVITGGVNVDLAHVRRVLAGHSVEAEVLPVPDPEWGVRIVLFADDGDLADWRQRLAEDLPRVALPKQFVRVERLPRTPGGKPDRAALLSLVGQ